MTTDGQPADGGGQLAPMSDERLAEIRENWTRVPGNVLNALGEELRILQRDRTDLLAEVTGLREREAALLAERERLLAVVRAMANCRGTDWAHDDSIFFPGDVSAAHVVEQARAALAAADAGERA